MALIVAGIDEAGYGPLLGPLCVGMTVFRVEGWRAGEPAPDLWDRLGAAVCRQGNDARRRIAVEDSKKLKLPNSGVRSHPLVHLERGVLAFLAAAGERPETDLDLFRTVGAEAEPHPWYEGGACATPVAMTPGEVGIAANGLVRALAGAGVKVETLRCGTVCETAFNDAVASRGTKAAAVAGAVGRHLRLVWERWGGVEEGEEDGGPRVVCDRQGGRTDYEAWLGEMVPGAAIGVLERTAERSRYRVSGRGGDGRERRMTVMFTPEAETHHMPVALASMTAKLVRELMMARFNRYWCGRCPELKPTAGYRQDGWRWLKDVGPVISAEERRAMVRRA